MVQVHSDTRILRRRQIVILSADRDGVHSLFVSGALDGLLENVEHGEVNESIMHEVVEGNLFAEVQHTRSVAELFAQRLVGKIDLVECTFCPSCFEA